MHISKLFFCIILTSIAYCAQAESDFSKFLPDDDVKQLRSLETLTTLPTPKTKAILIEHHGAKIKFLAESNARVSEITFQNSKGQERKFALKYPIEKQDIPDFAREAQILKKVGIPANNNVVQYYAYIEGQGMPILVMELLSSGSLADGPFDSSLDLYKQMANGIQQIHQSGFVHGDVKLENAGLTVDRKNVRVIDFGSAFSFTIGGYPKQHEDIGTNGYRAAELNYGTDKKTPHYLKVKPDENKEKLYMMTNGELYEATLIDTYAFAMSLYRKKYNLTDRDFSLAKSGKKKLPELMADKQMDALIKNGLKENPAQRLSFETFKNELDAL